MGSRATMHTDRLTIRHQPNLEEVFKHGLQRASLMGLAESFVPRSTRSCSVHFTPDRLLPSRNTSECSEGSSWYPFSRLTGGPFPTLLTCDMVFIVAGGMCFPFPPWGRFRSTHRASPDGFCSSTQPAGKSRGIGLVRLVFVKERATNAGAVCTGLPALGRVLACGVRSSANTLPLGKRARAPLVTESLPVGRNPAFSTTRSRLFVRPFPAKGLRCEESGAVRH